MKHLKKKRPFLVEQGWFFHWDNVPVHTATIVQDWLTAHSAQVLHRRPYSPGTGGLLLVLAHEG
jgi:hypothetical protein